MFVSARQIYLLLQKDEILTHLRDIKRLSLFFLILS